MYAIENTDSHIRVDFSGKVYNDDLLNAFREEVALPDYRAKNDLWIFDGCECDFSLSSFDELVSYISGNYPRNATRMKTAILTSNYLHNALGQLFCADADILPYSVRIFQDYSEAAAWLAE
ncbi:MAG TPA: hypothetical protein VN367_05760 [Chlorobaculum sp.]|nr:hypothetical protein [Chlorobaculum sp.]